jgi:hypothetical protein
MLIQFDKILEILGLYEKLDITGALHIGAHECEELPFYNQIGLSDDSVIWIDAIPNNVLKAKNRGIPNVYNHVITDKDDEVVVFNVSNNVQSSSVLELGTHLESYPDIVYVEKIQQKSITIDTFFKRNKLDASKYNFWNFDIQGAELMALKGAVESIQHAKMLYLEVTNTELYKNCGQITDIDMYLEQFGFKRVLTHMCLEGWGDALYILDSIIPPDTTFVDNTGVGLILYPILSPNTIIKSGKCGRLGNQIIKNLAVSLIAEKHDLFVDYYLYNIIHELGIRLFVGKNNYKNTIDLTEYNFVDIYNLSNINSAINPNCGCYYQTKEITNLIYNYLHSDIVKKCIMQANPFKDRYNSNNDLFIHIRLDDAAKWNPGIEYYIKAIQHISYDNLYISTDEKNHPIVKKLVELYTEKVQFSPLRFSLRGRVKPVSNKKVVVIDHAEIKTFQFGSTCKNIILSHGSFSAIIGYLSFFSNVYYPEHRPENMWYGDMFSIPRWNKIVY